MNKYFSHLNQMQNATDFRINSMMQNLNGYTGYYIASEVDAKIAALEKRIAVAINWINKDLRDKYPITLIDILTMPDGELNKFINEHAEYA